ncbi:MAG: sulfatase-like hydrolase/transferase, partial [bacterium]|nr:sulfatase-like hydrolase/transferase [bacterium]
SPSRAALISGRHFFRNGSHSQLHTPWHGNRDADPWNEVRGFALFLKDAGYHIGWSHKMHIAEDRMGGKQNNFRQAGGRVNQFSQTVSKVVGEAADAKGEADEIAAAKEKLYDECRKNFQAFLGKRKPGQPFYYSFHPTNPHRKWTKGSGKDLWGLNPDDLKGKLPAFLPDVHEVRQDMADYLGEAMAFDTALGHLLKRLEDLGELDNTMVVVSGDHGIPGFSRGKCNLYDFGTHVPLAVRWPGTAKPGRLVTDFINLLDLAPTFLEAGGSTPAFVMTG